MRKAPRSSRSITTARPARAITARQRHLEALVNGQSQVLEMISQGAPLGRILEAITAWVEAQSRDGVLASVLLLSPDGTRLLHGAAPSLPEAYNQAIHGTAIGPAVGSCGTAAFVRAPVIVSDIASDPRWADFRELALTHGLRACWSTPLIARHSEDGRVLGTFAMYYRHPHAPTSDDMHLIQIVTRTAVLAIEHNRAEEEREALRARESAARRQAEAERQRLHDLFMQAPALIAVLGGPDHVFELANPLYLQAVGKGREIMGMPIREALPELGGQVYYELLDQVYATGEPHEGREVLVRLDRAGDGTLEDVYFNFVYQPRRDMTGAIDGILVHAVDVTEQVRARRRVEESEERFRTLADNMSQFAWMADATGWIFWYNRRWYDYTGTTLEQMAGWGWQAVHHPDHVERVVRKIKACFESGEVWEDTFPLRGKDGQYRWFLSRAIPVRDDTGRVVRWFGTNTDITEQLQLDQQKDDFISIASHELKTPVASMKVSAQLLARRFRNAGDTRNAELLERMDRQLNRMTKLIADMLDQTRIERGKLQMQLASFDFPPLLAEVVEDVQRTAPSHTIEVERAPSVTLVGDRQRIGQVLTNLLTNAVKYSPGADRVVVCAEVADGELIARVQDFGIGIPAEKQAHVFDRYFRVADRESSEGESFPGLGLGLYISAEIVRQHGGRIWVESEAGKGSTFAFSLPVSPPPEANP